MQRLSMIQAGLLRQAVADGGPEPSRCAVAMGDPRRQTIVVVGADGQESQRQVSPGAWGVIWPIFQAAKRASGQNVLDGRRWAIVLNRDAVWLCRTDELGQALSERDRTDDGVAPELRASDSLGIIPMKGRSFDPLLIYSSFGQPQVPAGVKYIGVEDQDGVLAIIDGPGNPGSPVPNPRTRQFLAELLADALAVKGAAALVIAASSRQCYAVSAAALESIIARQAMPVARAAEGGAGLEQWHDAMRFIPNGVHAAANTARRVAADARPGPRALTFTGWVLAWALLVLSTALAYKLSIQPHEAFLVERSGLAGMGEAVAELPWGVLSWALLIACWPMIGQIIGLIFSKTHTWALYLFWVANGYDIAVHTQKWKLQWWPEGFDSLALDLGATVVAGGFALLTSLGNELALITSLVVIVVMSRGAFAALGMAANQLFIRTPIDLIFAGRTALAENRQYLISRAASWQLPGADEEGDPVYVYTVSPDEVRVHEPPAATGTRRGL